MIIMKIGPNEKCTCGSGLKYKKCCMHNKRPTKGVLSKFYDYGINDPFVTRLFFQILKIRDVIYTDRNEKTFDKLHLPILQNLMEARVAKDECINLINSHAEEIKNGIISKYDEERGVIQIDKTINLKLNLFFKDFFIRGVIAIKNTIALAGFIGYEISFLFGKDINFKKGKEKFLINRPERYKEWLDFMEDYRNQWYTPFSELRRQIEHESFNLPDVKYVLDKNNNIKALFPTLDFKKLDNFLNDLWEDLFSFCEEIVVFLLSTKLPQPYEIVLIPKEKINPDQPIKYALAVRLPGNDFPTLIT